MKNKRVKILSSTMFPASQVFLPWLLFLGVWKILKVA
jgi:hypothetical protein